MPDVAHLLTDPTAWAALLTLIVMEVVLGIDNLVFVSILTNRLPEERRAAGRQIGIGLALVLRLVLLGAISWIVGLKATVISLPFEAPTGPDGHAWFDLAFSWRDLILIGGGLFLVWKATREIHHNMEPESEDNLLEPKGATTFASAIVQILLLDLVFSIDSILTAVGMTDEIPIMFTAVIVAVSIMLLASGPLSRFIHDNPSVVMLALGFLLMIGTILIADGFGVHVPKGYVYAAMAFSAFVEALNMRARNRATTRSPRPASDG
jgi:predicted tellurium resistance membrane protein TerC